MNLLVWLMIPVVAAACQARLPTLWWIGGLRLELLPLVVAYASMTWRRPGTILLYAAFAGLAQDALSAAPFGLSVVGYSAGASANIWLRRWLDRDLPWVQMLAGAVVAGANGVLGLAVTGPSVGGFSRALFLAVLAGALAPFAFLAGDALRQRLEVRRG